MKNAEKTLPMISKEILIKSELKGTSYEYIGKMAVCEDCCAEVYVAEIEDYNLKALYDEYRRTNGIISTEKIVEIPHKYNIGKRPLSLLLGWGEMTFSRYCEGYIPTKQYAEKLQKIYDDPNYYLILLESNQANLPSKMGYEKSKSATEKLLGVDDEQLSKIDVIIDYLLCRCGDITPLTLQKALYYIQGFYFAFTGEFLFKEDCQAWVHGPAFPKIYDQYKKNGYDPISESEVCDESELMTFEKAIVDSIIRNFCCYSGKILESFTHSETPWLKARGNLLPDAPSNIPIPKEMIGEYFIEIKKRYNMLTPADIRIYFKRIIRAVQIDILDLLLTK